MKPPSSLIQRRHFLAGSAAVLGTPWPLRARAAEVPADHLVIGGHLPLSGPGSVVAAAVRNGLQMRIDEANEAGGIHGRQLRFVLEDSAGQASQAVRAVDKLIRQDRAMALLCPWGSGPNLATIKRITDAGVLCFAPFAASALLRAAAGASPLLYTTQLDYDATTAAGMGWLLQRSGRRRVGLIYDDSNFGETTGRGLDAALAARGLKTVATAGYKPGEIDLSPAVARLRAAEADLIVCASGTRETIAVCNEVKKLGWTGVDIATAFVARNGLTATLGGAAVEGLWGIGAWRITPDEEADAALRAWGASYRQRYKLAPDDVALSFYGHADWLLQGLRDAGRELTTPALMQALDRSSYRGLASYDTQRFVQGHVTPQWVRVEQVARGRWTARSEVMDALKARA